MYLYNIWNYKKKLSVLKLILVQYLNILTILKKPAELKAAIKH